MTRFIVGHRPVLEALRGHSRVRRLLVDSDDRFPDVREEAEIQGLRITRKERSELDRLSEGQRHQGVVAIAEPYSFVEIDDVMANANSGSVFAALDEITDPQNLGAIIRSAVTLGLNGVLIPKHRAAGISPAVVRASAGATEHATIARVVNLQRTLLSLHESGAEIIGLDANADTSIRDLHISDRPRVLVVGSEGKGLRRMVRERCDILVQIPQTGPMDSLNASVAAAIAMYALVEKRGGGSPA